MEIQTPVRLRSQVNPLTDVTGNARQLATVLKDLICRETVAVVRHRLGEQVQALVLAGSLARNEATFVEKADGWRLLGDAEMFVVLPKRVPHSPPELLKSLCGEITARTSRSGLQCEVTLSAVHPSFFQRLTPHIFAYELRTSGQVLMGDPQVLSLIPAFGPSEIPCEDAWRLLCNRMVEHLEVVSEAPDATREPTRRWLYRTAKLYLDMATSYLVFVGFYQPSYRMRAQKLSALAARAEEDSPFPLGPFAQRVAACTELKLLGDQRRLEALFSRDGWQEVWGEAANYARLLWRWELLRLCGYEPQSVLSDRALLRQWMQLQPLSRRLRGWAYVLRRRGWYRSRREWPRWIRQAWQASPRYWVYGAASELFFSLPRFPGPVRRRQGSDVNWEELRQYLPVVGMESADDGRLQWLQLASEIALNYHEFLEETRA